MYHGSEIGRGNRMLRKQKMEYSRGDDHWLGDGIYLYRDRLYAFRWIVIKYKERNSSESIRKDLLNKYIILKVEIDYDYDKMFSLFNPEHKMVFEHTREKCKGMAKYSKRLEAEEFTDGVILNIMFKNFDYGKYYSMVEAIFPLERCSKQDDSRTNGIDEYQLCIKDPNMILKLTDCSLEFKTDEYFDKLAKFNRYRSSHSIRYNV